MNDIRLKLYRYKLSLKKVLNKSSNVATRDGLILTFCEGKKILALGEIAPLPGFSRETIEEAEIQIVRSIKNIPLDRVLPGLMDSPLIETMIEHATAAKLYPSVEFGLCTAILNLISYLKKKPVRKLLSENAKDQIIVNALLSGSENEIIEKVNELTKKGFTTFKLKVGRQSIDEDIILVRKVYDITKRADSVLILDANRAWSVEDALRFNEGIKEINIDYIEEPVNDYLGILQLCNSGKFDTPIALDESLTALNPKAMENVPGVTALILKPTIIGFVKTLEFYEQAKHPELKTVISSSFESSIGLNALAEIASGFDATAGLDTISWFEEDTLKSSYEIKSGQIILKELPEQILNLESFSIEEIGLD